MLKYYILFVILLHNAFSHIFLYDNLKPEYLIEISADENIVENDNFIQEEIILKNQSYSCLIPLVSSNESSILDLIHSPEFDRNILPEEVEASEDKLRINEQDFLDTKKKAIYSLKSLSNQCLYYRWGWWTCSFCYGKDILQFHQSDSGSSVPKPDEGSIVYTLGSFESLKKNSDVLQDKKFLKSGNPIELENAISHNKKDIRIETTGVVPYLIYSLKQGTLCELTGSERTIEVQFYCSEDSKTDSIAWIKELRSCHYQMAIYTQKLCEIPIFVPSKKADPNKIVCKKLSPHNQHQLFTIPVNLNHESKMLDEGAFFPSKNVKFIVSINSDKFFKFLSNFEDFTKFYLNIIGFIQNKLTSISLLSYTEFLQLIIDITKQISLNDNTSEKLKNQFKLPKFKNEDQKNISFNENKESVSILLLILILINFKDSHQNIDEMFKSSKMYSLTSVDDNDKLYISIKKGNDDNYFAYLLESKIDPIFLNASVEYAETT